MPTTTELHDEVQRRLREQRERIAPRLRPGFDELLARHGFLTDDTATFFHPLIQPIVTFPTWVAEAVDHPVDPAGTAVLLDVVESTVAGYLHVRVHDDLLDEGLGSPETAMLLADAFLVRHQRLLAVHVHSERFWRHHEATAAAYAEAMLLERQLSHPEATYTEHDFDRVLDRSMPLVLPGAALLDLHDRWELLPELHRFVHHAVRAGQLVDDLIDCERDARHGNHTWVVRQLGGTEAPERMALVLVTGGLDDVVATVDRDLDAAARAASTLGADAAVEWVARRRAEVHRLAERMIAAALLG